MIASSVDLQQLEISPLQGSDSIDSLKTRTRNYYDLQKDGLEERRHSLVQKRFLQSDNGEAKVVAEDTSPGTEVTVVNIVPVQKHVHYVAE